MKRGLASGYGDVFPCLGVSPLLTAIIADVPNPMFYMPDTKMLFGDAKDTCEGMLCIVDVLLPFPKLIFDP